MAALLVGMSVMAVLMSAALPAWSHLAQRENEAELVWRGEQYARAIGLFQRKYANTFPPTIDVLVEQKFLRKKYKDPITNDDFQIIQVGGAMPGAPQPPGTASGGGLTGGLGQQPSGLGGQQSGGLGQQPSGLGGQQPGGSGQQGAPLGVQGVTSKSKETSLRLYNGMDKYNQWAFVYVAVSNIGGGGANPPTGGFGRSGGGAFGSPGGGGFGTPTPPGGGGGAPIFTPVAPGQPKMPPIGGTGPFGTPTAPAKPPK